MLLVVFLLSIFIFLLVSMIPGDPVYAMLGEEVSQEEYDRVFHELKLDQPVIVRYFSCLRMRSVEISENPPSST